MIRAVKFLAAFIVMVFTSWFLAFYWSESGVWWATHRPEWMVNLIYFIARPVLSEDITLAEDQLEFFTFWVPTFITMLCFLAGGYVYKRHNAISKG